MAKKRGSGITAKQRAARKRNMAVARAARKKGGSRIVSSSMTGGAAMKTLKSFGLSSKESGGLISLARAGKKGGRVKAKDLDFALSYSGHKTKKLLY